MTEASAPVSAPSEEARRKEANFRWILVRGALLLVFAGVIWFLSIFFHDSLLVFVTKPHFRAMEMAGYDLSRVPLLPRGYPTPILAAGKIAFIVSLALTFPLVVLVSWSFVRKQLGEPEGKRVRTFLPASLLLYASACVLGYTLLIPFTLYGFVWMSDVSISSPGDKASEREEAAREPSGDMAQEEAHVLKYVFNISAYLNLVLLLTVGLGALLQGPLVMAFLARIGRVSPSEVLRRWWIGLIAVGVLSMVLSPFPLSQLLLTLLFVTLPLLLIALAGAGLSHLSWKGRSDTNEPVTG